MVRENKNLKKEIGTTERPEPPIQKNDDLDTVTNDEPIEIRGDVQPEKKG